MIHHPVKRRCAHDAVERALKGQMQKVSGNQPRSHIKLWPEVFAGRSQHILRKINANHAPPGQSLHQFSRHTASAAAGVEHNFIATQSQTRQYFLAPTDLWLGEAVVNRRIPLARTKWRLISQKKYRPCENRNAQNLIREDALKSVAKDFLHSCQCLIEIIDNILHILDAH